MPRSLQMPTDFHGYTKAQLEEIEQAGGGLVDGKTLTQLQEAIETEITVNYIAGRRIEHEKPPPDRAAYRKIERTADRLLKLLKVGRASRPHAAPNIRGLMTQQGYEWAHEWHESVKREKLEKLHRQAMARKLPSDEAEKLSAQSKSRFHESMDNLEKRRRSHGSWPESEDIETRVHADGSIEIIAYGQDEAFRVAVEGVQRLRTWAELAGKSERDGKYTGPKSGQRWATTRLVAQLTHVYKEYFGRDFGVGKPAPGVNKSNEVGGPGVRFIQACLEPRGIHMTGYAIEKAWDSQKAAQEK